MTERSLRGRRRALGLAFGLLAAGTTAACSAQSGAAAVVEGRPIPLADVQEATGELAPYLQDATPSSVLLLLVATPTLERVAAENGVAVSEQQAEQLLTDLAAAASGAAPGAESDAPETAPSVTFAPASVTVARFTLLQEALSQLPDAQAVQQDLLARLADLDVDVNPRYGDLDFSQGGVVPVEHPWLVTPAP